MANQTQTELTNTVLKEIFDLWDSRAGLYREVMYSSALLRVADVWRNVCTFFHPLHKHEQRGTSLDADYGDFRLRQGVLRIEDAKQTLTDVAEKEKLSLPKQPSVEIKASLHPGSSRHFWRGGLKNLSRRFPVL